MDDGQGGQFTQIYDGSNENNNLFHLKSGLKNGLRYSFRAFAVNFNGISQPSQIVSYYACTAPTNIDKPHIVSQSKTDVTISWMAPKDDGGCRVTTFVIYRNDGEGGLISQEMNTVQDANVRNYPSLNTLTISNFPENSQGKTFKL